MIQFITMMAMLFVSQAAPAKALSAESSRSIVDALLGSANSPSAPVIAADLSNVERLELRGTLYTTNVSTMVSHKGQDKSLAVIVGGSPSKLIRELAALKKESIYTNFEPIDEVNVDCTKTTNKKTKAVKTTCEAFQVGHRI